MQKESDHNGESTEKRVPEFNGNIDGSALQR